MQDPTTFHQPLKPHFPEQEHLKCPRCESPNTKFCYYNNYNLSQPRHFCKNCRRYWTKGGALRNIPVGGGTRKHAKKSSSNTKRPPSSSSSTTTTTTTTSISSAAIQNSVLHQKPHQPIGIYTSSGMELQHQHQHQHQPQDHQMLDISGSFSSLLASNGQFRNLLEMGLNGNGNPVQEIHQFGEFIENSESKLQSSSNGNHQETLLLDHQNGGGGGGGAGGGDSSCWGGGGGGGNGWPDLAIYTPGSNFH